ncbi:OprD family outer membrane porin [Pseudomonas lini]
MKNKENGRMTESNPSASLVKEYADDGICRVLELGGGDAKGFYVTESSKDLELAYVIQSGPAKDLAFRVREAFYRNEQGAASTFRSDNETRINVDYTIKIW